MTKEEYEKYARDHRKELDAQEVKLGDVVTVCIGQFAGETGIIVGIFACHNDYTDPYYEVDMNCEVPEKYKCRKTLISPNNVIGGLSAHEFKVIGNCAPKQPSMEIKQGDKVMVSKDAPRIYTPDWVDAMFDLVLKVTEVEDGNAMVEFAKRTPYRTVLTAIPTKYLVKVDAEVGVGDRVIVHYPNSDRIGRIQEVMLDGTYDIDYGGGCTGHNITRSQIEPYTAPKFKVGDRVRNVKSDLCGIALKIEHGIVEVGIPYDKEKHYWNTDIVELFEPTEQTEEEKKPNIGSIKIPVEVDLSDSYWDAYTADIAKEVALKVANKFNDPKEAAEYAVKVAKAVVDGLKRK